MTNIPLSPFRKKLLIKTLLAFPFVFYFFWGTWAQLGVVVSIVTLNLLFVLFADESFLLKMAANKAFISKSPSSHPDYFYDPKFGFDLRNIKRRKGF